MTKPIKVGDLVISHTTREYRAEATVGRPALVIDVNVVGDLLLKVGTREWWDTPEECEKVSE